MFLAWVGDHGPRHVHVFRDRRFIVKWDLESWQAMRGTANAGLKRYLLELVEEGLL